MKKTYQMMIALVALLLGAMNVSAEEVSLETVPFWAHESAWGLDAPKNTELQKGTEGENICLWVIGTAAGNVYGDTNVNAFADLSGFDKLIVTVAPDAGSPRFLFNRDADEGQYNANEAESHLIDNTKGGWLSKYFAQDGNTYTVDLKQMVNDKGYAHLHAIKGANWQNVTIESMMLERKGKEKQIGWVNIITNSDMEGDDVSSFITVLNGDNNDGDKTYPAVIEDGCGVDGTRGISLKSMENAPQTWSTQLFVKLPEVLAAGTQWKFSMDVMSDPGANVSVAAHAQPRQWKDGGNAISADFADGFTTSPSWTKVEAKGTISQSLVDKEFQSICFDLNNDQTTATQYYFDNIKFEIYKFGTTAEFYQDNVQVDFGFETNIPELCKAAGKGRVLFANETAKVKVNGKEVGITSVEGYADGRFYIYLDEPADDKAEVEVIFNNPAGDMQLKYAGGPNAGQAVPSVDEIADFNEELPNVESNDVFPYTMLPPSIISAKPEYGSFNIAANLKEFKVTFDKKANAKKMVATLDGTALTISPADGLAEEFTLTYAGADMANGLHSIRITKVYPEDESLGEEVFTDTTYVFSVGAPDASDVAFDLIPASYFNTCGNNSIPEGFKVYADGMEERTPGNTYGSNARLFNDFADGGDFKSALYFRRNYVTYGLNDDEHVLSMEAGKTYTLTFNAARWKSSGEFMKVVFLNADAEEVYSKPVTCNPDVNGSKNAVKGSSAYTIEFTPETSGNYELRFVVCTDAEGTEAGDDGMREVLLANVKLSYIPKTFGVVEMLAVNEALEKAEQTQASYADERYDGAAQTALTDAISKVQAEKDNYTSPSECTAATEELNAKAKALTDHALLCNDYDNIIKNGADVVRQNENASNTGLPTKFVTLDLFAQLKAAVDKYHGVSVMQNDGTEEEPNWQKHYTFDVLKEDAALNTAIEELTDIVNTTQKLFTTGESKRNTTGVAALTERLRLGAETLKALGETEESFAVQAGLNALEDDDEVAEMLKNNIKVIIYSKMKEADNPLFTPNEETGETAGYDMTVFVKNPNIYAPAYSQEVPGWTNLKDKQAVAWSSWDGNVSHNTKTPYVEDCCLHPGWHAVAAVEQIIDDLPAGIYNIKINANDNSSTSDGTFAYVKLSDTPEVAEEAEFDKETNAAGYVDVDNQGWDREINNVVVLDGVLTLGFAWGPESQAFLEGVRLELIGAADVDYSSLYNDAVTGVENATAAKVRAIELFDLNGQRIPVAKKGIVIVKKYMSDGTIVTEKVVK